MLDFSDNDAFHRRLVVGLLVLNGFLLCFPSLCCAQDVAGTWVDDNVNKKVRIDQQGRQLAVTALDDGPVLNAKGTIEGDNVRIFWRTNSGREVDMEGKHERGVIRWSNGSVWKRQQFTIVSNRGGASQAVSITVGGKTYLLIPDTANPLVWYYTPDSVRLLERRIGDEVWPEISVLRFQRRKTPEELKASPGSLLVEGTTLYFAAPIKIKDEAVLSELADRLVQASPVLRTLTTYMPWVRQDGSIIDDHQWRHAMRYITSNGQLPLPIGSRDSYGREFPTYPADVFKIDMQSIRVVAQDPIWDVITSNWKKSSYDHELRAAKIDAQTAAVEDARAKAKFENRPFTEADANRVRNSFVLEGRRLNVIKDRVNSKISRNAMFGAFMPHNSNAFVQYQKLKVLPELELKPLPVLQATLTVDGVTSNGKTSSTLGLRRPKQERSDPRRDLKYSKMPFFIGLNKLDSALVDDILTRKFSGLPVQASMQYHLPAYHRLPVLPTDPGEMLSSWLNELGARRVRTRTEQNILEILYAERLRAYRLGYRPEHLSERWDWANLLRKQNYRIDRDDPNDNLQKDRLRKLRLAAYYLVHLIHQPAERVVHRYMVEKYARIQGDQPQLAGNTTYREWIRDMLQLRKQEGPDLLNFMCHPIYFKRPKYNHQSRQNAGQWVLFPTEELNAAKQDALMLFEKPVFKYLKITVEYRTVDGFTDPHTESTLAELEPGFQIPWDNRVMEKDFRTLSLGRRLINLERYSDSVIQRLFGIKRNPILPGAVVLPDPAEDDYLGYRSISVSPVIRFRADADATFTSQLTNALQSTEQPIEVKPDGEFVELQFPAADWDPQHGWRGMPIPVLEFSFAGIDPDFAAKLKANSKFLEATYVIRFEVHHAGGDVSFEEVLPVFRGVKSLPSMFERLEKVGEGRAARLKVINVEGAQ